MDSERDDSCDDDDVTIVGDHELLVELRRAAAERATVPGMPLPPPVVPGPACADDPRAVRRSAASRRPAPLAPAPDDAFGADDWWADDDDGGHDRSRLAWISLAIVVAAVAVAALLILL